MRHAILALFMLLPALAQAMCAEIVAEPIGEARVQADAFREAVVEKWVKTEISNEAQNQKWIDNEFEHKIRVPLQVIYENALMKPMNAELDKDVVTSVTNFNKFNFQEEINRLIPGLRYDLYADYKSVRLAVHDEITPELLAKLEKVFATVNHRFRNDPEMRNVLRASDLEKNWFMMGLGYTADQAALAARVARDLPGPVRIAHFWDPAVRDVLNRKLTEFKKLHKDLLKDLKDSKLLVREDDWMSLHLDVFTAARKAKSVDQLKGSLGEYFPSFVMTDDIALKINRYARLADDFSPSMLVAKRESIAIHDAPYGAISLDFIGLGARNLKATAKALALGETLSQVVDLSREYEREVTREFEKQKAMVRAAIQNYLGDVVINFSGDDGVVILNRDLTIDELQELMNRLSALQDLPYFRMVHIDGESTKQMPGVLITHAENMEKEIREMLKQKGAVSLSQKITIQILISESQAFLLLSSSVELVEAERNILKRMFPRAVDKIVRDIHRGGGKASYEPMDLYAFPQNRLILGR